MDTRIWQYSIPWLKVAVDAKPLFAPRSCYIRWNTPSPSIVIFATTLSWIAGASVAVMMLEGELSDG
jgi:hypothetical protein